jgi:hypothetical protein
MDSTSHTPQDDVTEKAQAAFTSLNKSVIDSVQAIVTNNNPTADLWQPFRKVIQEFHRQRTEIVDLITPKLTLSLKKEEKDTCAVYKFPKKDEEFTHTIPEEDISVLWPLSSSIQRLLHLPTTAKDAVIKETAACTTRIILKTMLAEGELLYNMGKTQAVIRISPNSTSSHISINTRL